MSRTASAASARPRAPSASGASTTPPKSARSGDRRLAESRDGQAVTEMSCDELDRLEELFRARRRRRSPARDMDELVRACMDENHVVIDLERRRQQMDRGPCGRELDAHAHCCSGWRCTGWRGPRDGDVELSRRCIGRCLVWAGEMHCPELRAPAAGVGADRAGRGSNGCHCIEGARQMKKQHEQAPPASWTVQAKRSSPIS